MSNDKLHWIREIASNIVERSEHISIIYIGECFKEFQRVLVLRSTNYVFLEIKTFILAI